jgi:hypothetical protein
MEEAEEENREIVKSTQLETEQNWPSVVRIVDKIARFQRRRQAAKTPY